MRAQPGPAYKPNDYTRGYSRELVVDHVGECLSIFHELDEERGVPAELATSVFTVIQTMVVAVEPVPGTAAAARTAQIVTPNGAESARLLREV